MLAVKSLLAFRDNVIWIIENENKQCIVVDPGDADIVLDYIRHTKSTLEAVWVTHHHADHTAGLATLCQTFPHLKIYGPKKEQIATCNHRVEEGDVISAFGYDFSVLDLPGHTKGHIGFYGDNMLFCGDVLFSAGCGRVFEGTYQQMYASLQKIAQLPDETVIYCAHDYTAQNIAFARAVEPQNTALHLYEASINQLTQDGSLTIPTTLKQEKAINPFLRCSYREVRQVFAHLSDITEEAVFVALRQWKNDF